MLLSLYRFFFIYLLFSDRSRRLHAEDIDRRRWRPISFLLFSDLENAGVDLVLSFFGHVAFFAPNLEMTSHLNVCEMRREMEIQTARDCAE